MITFEIGRNHTLNLQQDSTLGLHRFRHTYLVAHSIGISEPFQSGLRAVT